jgi:hypothetical protein
VWWRRLDAVEADMGGWRRKWCWTDDEAGGAGWMVAYVETSG